MPAPISPAGIRSPLPIEIPGESKRPGAFEAVFKETIDKVEEFRRSADETIGKFLSGESEEVHETVLAVQRAELAFELFLQVRNKVVQAYQEIMRMQI